MSSNSSTGQILGYVVGAVVGYFTGGASYILMGAAVGGAIGGAIDPPKGPHLQGPRLNDLSVQTASYGAAIPRVYGTIAQFGNIFWIENNKLKETSNTSGGGKGGGGGASSTTFTYSATFAVGLCEGPIAGVKKIWVGSKLVYDAGNADMESLQASNEAASFFTVYTGSDTQLPDPRMEAEFGVGEVPAYRGLAYIVFSDYPLADHGNSLLGAQVKVEIVTAGLDVVNSSVSSTIPAVPNGAWSSIVYNDGKYVAIQGANNDKVALSEDGITWQVYANADGRMWNSVASNGRGFVAVAGSSRYASYSANGRVWQLSDMGITTDWMSICVNKSTYFAIGIASGHNNTYVAISGNGSAWTVINDSLPKEYWFKIIALDNDRLLCLRSTAVAISDDSGLHWTEYTLPVGSTAYQDVCWNGLLIVAIQGSGSDYATSPDGITWTLHSNMPVFAHTTISHGFGKFFVASATTDAATSKNGVDWTLHPGLVSLNASATAFNGAWFVSVGTASTVATRAFFTFSNDPVELADIITAEVLRSNLLSVGDLDVSLLTQDVRGYRVASVAALRSAIEPLQGAWPFDVIQDGYKVKFVPRGSSSIAALSESDLDARQSSDKASTRLSVAREMESQLPVRVTVKHLDVNRDYDPGDQYSSRSNTTAINQKDIDMPIVMTSDEAMQTAERLLYMYWLERYDLSFKLPPSFRHLQPCDVVTLTTAHGTYDLRITAITYTPDGRLECSAKYNNPTIYNSTALGEAGQSTGITLGTKGRSIYRLMDVPTLIDTLDGIGYLVAMGGSSAAWPGGLLYRTEDGQTWSQLAAFPAPGATIGEAANVIGAGRTDLIDTASALTVYLSCGALFSVTEGNLLNGANHFAYGAHGRWEIIAAKNCVLQSDGSYLLTDLLRGRFGTEWAAGSHAINDSVVLLDSSKIGFISASLNSINLARNFRAITLGKTIDSDIDESFTYTGVNMECLSPVYVTGSRPASGDWNLGWVRRTRVGGEWRDYVDAPVGEASEAYEIDIYSDASFTTIKRTLSVTSAVATYTSAQQVTDFGWNQPTLYIKVYQLSANVGRGYPGQKSMAYLLSGEDLYVNNVVLAMHMDDAGLTDLKGHAVTLNGGMGRSAAQSKFGGFSALFDGVNDYLSLANSPDWLFGAGDFTIDYFVRLDSVVTTYGLVGVWNDTTGRSWGIYHAAGVFQFSYSINGTTIINATATSGLTAATWAHIAFCRSGADLRIFVDGTQIGTTHNIGTSSLFASTQPLLIGAAFGLAYPTGGYIDDLRITKSARFVENFTAPTAAFPNY